MVFNLSRDEEIRALQRANHGLRIGLTSGVFDLFHVLHLVYLQKCAALCDVLVVGVDSDYLVRTRKGGQRPIIPQHERLLIVDALQCVRYTFIMDDIEDFGRASNYLKVHTIFKNESYDEGDIIGQEYAYRVVTIPDVMHSSSTTELIERLHK